MLSQAQLAPGVLVSFVDPETRHVRVTFHPEGRLENVFYVSRIVTQESRFKLREVHTAMLDAPVPIFDGKMPALVWPEMVKFEFYLRRQFDARILKVEAVVNLDPWTKDIRPYAMSDQGGVLTIRTDSLEKPTVFVSGIGVVSRNHRSYRFAAGTMQLSIGASPRYIAFCTSGGDCRTELLPGINMATDIGVAR